MVRYAAQAAKAIYAGIVAGLGALAAVLVGDVGLSDVTAGQWVTVALAALIAFGGVYGIRNAEPQ
jgi:hypothetical protein